MEFSGLDLAKLTLDDIVNAMRLNAIRQITIDTHNTTRLGNAVNASEYDATITEWFGAETRVIAPN